MFAFLSLRNVSINLSFDFLLLEPSYNHACDITFTLSQQLRIVNKRTIIADFCTYRFLNCMFCFAALTNLSIIFHANEFVLCTRNAK